YIPRPRNAFIIFRSAYVQSQKADASIRGSLHQTAVSCLVADVWRGMSDEERKPYFLLAQQEKTSHKLKYPDYQYLPKK
ncbi:high mobility group box domain-containing protein, partial [Mycena haematopus]